MSFVKKLEKTVQIVWFLTEKKGPFFEEFPRQSAPWRLCYSIGTQVFMIKIWKEYFLVNLGY
jgi:hypothetical protein